MGDAGQFAMFLAQGAIMVALLLGPVGQAIGRRIAAGKAGKRDPATGLTTGEMAAERVGQLEARVAELEERLEFTERLLHRVADDRAVSGGPER